MSRIVIEGGERLRGELTIQGSKNATLPMLAAALLVRGEVVLSNCPDITDVRETVCLLRHLGCQVEQKQDEIRVDSTQLRSDEVKDRVTVNSRISTMLLGALTGRQKHAVVCYPGGCTIGRRPIDYHLAAFRKMGIVVLETPEWIQCEAGTLSNTVIKFPSVSVGATESVILASVLSEATIRIQNAAREPEICYLCDFLRKCGACIHGDGSPNITIVGVKTLHPCRYEIPSDRIVCGTYLLAGAVTGGNVYLHCTNAFEVQALRTLLTDCGCKINGSSDGIRLEAPSRLSAIPYTQTEAYPGFPTDMQSQLSAVLCLANGTSMVRETIFEQRFQVVPELRKMGASIEISKDVLIIEGRARLTGASLSAKELRGSAALVLAGLAAKGVTELNTDRFLNRGYRGIVSDLRQLGAKIRME